MRKLKTKLTSLAPEEWVLLAALVCAGGFNEFISCALSVLTAALLTVMIIKKRRLTLRLNIGTAAVALIVLGSLFTCLFARDRGEALIGFFKVLPLLLFALLITQEEKPASKYAHTISRAAAVLGTLSAVLMYIPLTSRWFASAGRLAGTFQYPNTFALFLTVGMLCSLSAKKLSAADVVCAALTGAGIIMTGSRAAMPLAAAALFVLLFFRLRAKGRIILASSAAAVVLALVLLAPVLRDSDIFGRLYAFSLSESTFVGRLLYWQDALPLLLKSPFGTGYLGWFYAQSALQTGVYSVRFVHNDILQLALDFGWIPCLLFIAAVVSSIFRKGKPLAFRLVTAVIFLHSLFDFDLQFTAMFFILLLFMELNSGRELALKRFAAVGVIVPGLLSLWFAAALGLSYFGMYDASDAMYPANTENIVCVLKSKKTIEEQSKVADRLLKNNSDVLIALDAKARYFYSEGNFDKVIHYKRRSLEQAPLVDAEYEDYIEMLTQGTKLYRAAGDKKSASVCENELKKVSEAYSRLDERLSPLGRMIADQPNQ